jgi:D-alanyl-D-alanine carboxypeptidase
MYDTLGGKEALSHKEDASKLREFVLTFLPNYDSERVYDSDVRKLFQWYNTLLSEGLLTPEVKEESKEEEKVEKKTKTAKAVQEAKPVKAVKSATTKSAVKSASGAKKVAAVKTGSSRGK